MKEKRNHDILGLLLKQRQEEEKYLLLLFLQVDLRPFVLEEGKLRQCESQNPREIVKRSLDN